MVGDTLRRLAAKRMMSDRLTVNTLAALRPSQVGFGGKNTCESLGISLQALVDNCPLGDTWILATGDITNAFNTVERQAVLEGVARLAPHLLPWASRSLGVPSPLFCGLHEIKSQYGVHQGNLLGPRSSGPAPLLPWHSFNG